MLTQCPSKPRVERFCAHFVAGKALSSCFDFQLTDFDIKSMIAHGTDGAVFRATCQQARHPDKTKVYALKAMFNVFELTSVTQVRGMEDAE